MGKTTLTPKPPEFATGAPTARSGSAPGPRACARLSRVTGADEAEVLRLTENVGSMGHWYKNMLAGEVTWSAQTFRIFGLDEATFEPTLKSIFEVCHPEVRARVEATVKAAIDGQDEFEFDFRIARPDGTWRTIISTPAAMSQGFRRYSQYASAMPLATWHMSIAADPSRRTPCVASVKCLNSSMFASQASSCS